MFSVNTVRIKNTEFFNPKSYPILTLKITSQTAMFNDEDFFILLKSSRLLSDSLEWCLTGRNVLLVRSLLCPFRRLWKGCLDSPMYWRPQTEHIYIYIHTYLVILQHETRKPWQWTISFYICKIYTKHWQYNLYTMKTNLK